MGDIRYVSLSDTHFGADNSLLTRLQSMGGPVDPMHPSDAMVHLVNCLRHVILENTGDKKPTLILNGDIFDLAFSTENIAAMAFRSFLELAMPQDPAARLFDPNIVFIPGNHDHHYWETARERRYVEQLHAADWSKPIAPAPHITPMRDPPPIPSHFVEAISRSLPWLEDVAVTTAYPNLSFRTDEKLVIFTHGHFIEDAYLLMSKLAETLYPKTKPPVAMNEWEAENFAWIDFVWSDLGRSGRIGQDEQRVYETAQSPSQLGRLLGNAARNALLAQGGSAGRFLGDGVAAFTETVVAESFERNRPETLLADHGAGLKRFLSVPVQNQIHEEYADVAIPTDIAVVFGHTHKPFARMMKIAEFLVPEIKVYNSGGWVVDSPTPQTLHGGAVILMDDDLNLASLRMYNEGPDRSAYAVSVQAADAEARNPLYARLAPLVKPNDWPWSNFSAAAFTAVRHHNETLNEFLHRQGAESNDS